MELLLTSYSVTRCECCPSLPALRLHVVLWLAFLLWEVTRVTFWQKLWIRVSVWFTVSSFLALVIIKICIKMAPPPPHVLKWLQWVGYAYWLEMDMYCEWQVGIYYVGSLKGLIIVSSLFHTCEIISEITACTSHKDQCILHLKLKQTLFPLTL